MTSKSHAALGIVAIAGALWLSAVPAAFAEDTTTTTTTEHHSDEGPGAIITAPARAAGDIVDSVVGGRHEGCSKKTVTKTDGDTGDSMSKTRTDCD